MAAAGIPAPVADRAYKFTQVAWGRLFLSGFGIEFAPDYLCFNATGDVIESGQLAEQPFFVAAMDAGKRHPPPNGLPRLALMSADVNCFHRALSAGSNPKDLVSGPTAMFMETPTPAGMDKASQLLAQRLEMLAIKQGIQLNTGASQASRAPSKIPWWKFW